jgi:hypothetical protein
MACIKTVALLILGYTCAAPACAQRDACQHRTVPVSVARNDDVPVDPLSSANFEATYRKKPVRIISATITQAPSRVVLLLDVSGSMRDPRSESNWKLMVDLAEDVLSAAPPASELGLGFFSKELDPVALPTTDRKSLLAQLESLRSRKRSLGQTALWAAILDSLKMLDRPHLGDVIYVITDGEDNKSRVTMNKVTQTLDETGVRLFAFLFQRLGFDAGRGPVGTSGPIDMLRITEDTGGRAIGFSTFYQDAYFAAIPVQDPALVDQSGKPTWLGSHLRSQYRQIFNFYRVDIDLPEAVDKTGDWRLDLVGFDKSQRDKMVLKYPHKLGPCY